MTARTAHLEISGMSCATCSSTVAEATRDLSGVTKSTVNFATDEGIVEYDPGQATLEEIYTAIESAGYEPIRRRETLEIGGMSCATCAQTIEDALESVPGVIDVDVNFATDEAVVEWNPVDTDREAIETAIESAGYEPIARSRDSGADGNRPSAVERELVRQRRLVVGGGILTAPFVLVMLDMLRPGTVPPTILGIDFAWFEFGLATVLMATLGREFIRGAIRAALVNHRANMDTLVAVGASAGYVYSTVVLFDVLTGGLYFEAVAFILWFITLGNWLEVRSKARASDSLRKLLELEADEATVVGDDGVERTVALDAVSVGDTMKVKPGERIPTDGVIVDGRSAVDESMVTGESIPVEKEPGDEVIGSTINENGVLYVEATRIGRDTAIQRIVRRVKEAQARQPSIQRTVDRVSAYFVPAVIVNAVLWSLVWYVYPGTMYSVAAALPLWNPVGGGPITGVPVLEFSMVVLASSLLIACPCALGLATPAATMVGSTIAATNGVLYRGADILEEAQGIDIVVFDKTGTLTRGAMRLTDVVPLGPTRVSDGGVVRESRADEDRILAAAASAESASEHPLARAIVEGARERGVLVDRPDVFESVPGHGVRAETSVGTVVIGNRKLMRDSGVDIEPARAPLERLENDGKTAMLVAIDGDLAGVVAVADTVREGAKGAVAALSSRGIETVMMTGDNARTARAVAQSIGISESNVRADVLPEDKADIVESLQKDGARVMMVGDGVNDAPALTVADIGVAIGGGTDVAIESADVTLMRDDPADVLKVIRIAEATNAKIKQNLFWALVYNATLIPIASLGLLSPALAAFAMAGSSVSVMANSLGFRRYDPHTEYRLFDSLR